MNCAFNRRSLAALVYLLALGAWAAEVEWSLRPRHIRQGERATLTVTVRGARQAQPPRLPEIEGLHVSGPATQSSTQIRLEQGRMQRESHLSFRYELLALQTGEFTLGPLRYDLEAETVELPALQLSVRSTTDPSGSTDSTGEIGDQALRARLVTERSRLYQGEVFYLTLELLHQGLTIGQRIELLNLPQTGLDLPPFQELAPGRETLAGRVYDVRRFRTVATAQSPGNIILEPLLRVPVVTARTQRERRSPFGFEDPFFDGFFRSGEQQRVSVTAEKLALDIRPLPVAGRPADFSGAVGRFRFDVRVEPVDLAVGEPLTVTMILSGQGNLDQVRAPQLQAPDTFRKYDPQLIDQDLSPATGEGRKTYQQVLIPRSEKADRIPPIAFSYFDPHESEYKTLQHGPFDLTLQPAAEGPAEALWPPGVRPQETAPLGSDILHLKAWRAGPASLGFPLALGPRTAIVLAAAPLLLLLLAGIRNRQRARSRRDPALRLRRTAPQKARRDVRAAQKALRERDPRAFFEHLAAALQRYYGSRLHLPPGEVLPERVCEALASGGWPASETRSLRAMFQACEEARFGGPETGKEVLKQRGNALLRETVRLLRASERIRLRP